MMTRLQRALDIFSTGLQQTQHVHPLTGRFELPEVDVDQNKVDDSGAVPFSFFWFEDVAFLQAFTVKNFGVDLRKGELVHSSPLLCKQKLLRRKFTNQKCFHWFYLFCIGIFIT